MTNSLKNKGLYNRYEVKKTSGSPIDPKAKYFVLRYDNNGNDKKHLEASRFALFVYAELVKDHLPNLSEDLKKQLIKCIF